MLLFGALPVELRLALARLRLLLRSSVVHRRLPAFLPRFLFPVMLLAIVIPLLLLLVLMILLLPVLMVLLQLVLLLRPVRYR